MSFLRQIESARYQARQHAQYEDFSSPQYLALQNEFLEQNIPEALKLEQRYEEMKEEFTNEKIHWGGKFLRTPTTETYGPIKAEAAMRFNEELEGNMKLKLAELVFDAMGQKKFDFVFFASEVDKDTDGYGVFITPL